MSDLTMHLTSIESTVAGWRRGEIPADVAMKAVGAYVTDAGLLADPATDEIIIPDELRQLNRTRCDRWHPPTGDDWTLGDWSNAFMGEGGELANVVKKLRRHQSGHATSYNTPEVAELRARFCEEVADVLLYLDLLTWKAGVTPADLVEALYEKFDLVSAAQGWDDLKATPS